MSNGLQVQLLSGLDPGVWTDVAAPDDYNHVAIEDTAGNGVRWRTDKTDATTEKTIRAGAEQAIAIPQAGALGFRFPKGVVRFSVKPVSGTGPVALVWMT
jgi:hypothetical protein